jgi:glutathione S-transferase
MSKLTLTYFDNPLSRGEECRLALFMAGVDFVDNRIKHDAWSALKPTTPFGSLPVLELEGKPAVSQSNAILGWVGRKYGLLSTDEWEAMRQDSLMSAVEELRAVIGRTFGISDAAELKRRRQELVEGPLRSWLANAERQVRGPFTSGETISVADLKLFLVIGWLKKGVLDHVPADVVAPFPKLERLFEAVGRHPKIVEWYARPSKH